MLDLEKFIAAARDLDAYVATLDAGEALGEAEHLAKAIGGCLLAADRNPALLPVTGDAMVMLSFALSRVVAQYVRKSSIIPTAVEPSRLHACTLAARMGEAAL